MRIRFTAARFQTLLCSTLLFACASLSQAASITYNVNWTFSANDYVTGTIQTDGTLGLLSASNITGWSLDGSALNHGTGTMTGPSPTFTATVTGTDLTATSTDLLFNFSGTDGGYFALQSSQYRVVVATHLSDVVSFATSGAGEGLLNGPWNAFSSTAKSGTQSIADTGTPEPASFALVLGGIALLGFRKMRRRA